jgi:hypothetical protein
MTLFWLLCVSLVLGGLAFRHPLRGALDDLWLYWFGVRVRAVRPQGPPPDPGRSAVPPSRHDFLPPPRGINRAG